jgi:hypothetical protein
MATLNERTNAVLQEFGGLIPESICSFEDAKREYAYTRSLELQKLGIAGTDRTVTNAVLDPGDDRDGAMPSSAPNLRDIIPAAVEFQPTNTTDRYKVVILSNVEDVPAYEGNRAISFYGEPLRYRLAWDSWDAGDLYVYYDPVEDIEDLTGASEITFPLAFWTYLTKKTAFILIDMVRLKLTWLNREEEKEQLEKILKALDKMEVKLAAQVAEWCGEFQRYINLDRNEGPYLRRSNLEIMARGYNDTSGPFGGFE